MKVCPKCGEKKPLITEYWARDKGKANGFRGWCKKCDLSNSRIYALKNKEKSTERGNSWRTRLCYNYVKETLIKQGLPVTPEMIELKRQQIIMKRTLKLFKKWRFENESDSTDVQGKQCEDEKDYVRAVQC